VPSPCRLIPESDTQIRCATCGETFAASALSVEVAERIEGGSAPDQSTVAMQLSAPCPAGGDGRDTLHLGYGPTASRRDGELMLALGKAQRTDGRTSCD